MDVIQSSSPKPVKDIIPGCATSRRIHQIDEGSFHVGDVDMEPSQTVQILGVMMEGAINKFVSQYFFSLRKIKSIRRSLFTVTLIIGLICSRIDYCHTIFAGLPNGTINRL